MVGYVDKKGEHGLIVLVPQKGQQWLSRFLRVGIPQKECGKENTRLILEFVQRQGLKAEAAECCANYAYDGIKAGEAFLPSIEELKCLYVNKRLVNQKLALICGAKMFVEWYYWSSSEYSDYSVWSLSFRDGYVETRNKHYNTYARPVLAF